MMYLLCKYDVCLRAHEELLGICPEHIMAAAGGCIISAQAEHHARRVHHVCPKGKHIIPIR